MSRYSRIFHHIDIKDVKKKRHHDIVLEKNREDIERKPQVLVEGKKFKSNWRKDLTEDMRTTTVFIDTVEPNNNDISNTPAVNNVDVAGGGWDGSASFASGTGSGYDGGINWEGKNYAAWSGLSGHSNRSIIYDVSDLSQSSTITIQAIQGDYNNGAKAAGDSGVGVFLGDADGNWVDLGYIINPSEGNYIQWHTGYSGDSQGFRADTFDGMTSAQETEVRNLYTTYLSQSGETAKDTWYTMYGKIYSYKGLTTGSDPKSFSVDIPDAYRQKNVTIQLYQTATGGQDPWSSSVATNPYAITSIITKRISPISLVVSLDSPQASSFIRDGTIGAEETSREKKRKEVEMRLEAAKNYVEQHFDKDFPGSKYTPPGRGVTVDASPQNAQDQYAAWADALKDDYGNPLFPGGYQNFWDRHADRDGNIPYPSAAYDKIKTLSFMRPPFYTGLNHGSATQAYINSINAENARGQARNRREAELKKQLQAWLNQKNKDNATKLKQSSTGTTTKTRVRSGWQQSVDEPRGPYGYSPTPHQNDPSPQANPWSLGNIAQGQTGYSRDSTYGLQPDGTLGQDEPFPDVGDEDDILDWLGAPGYPQAKQSKGGTKIAAAGIPRNTSDAGKGRPSHPGPGWKWYQDADGGKGRYLPVPTRDGLVKNKVQNQWATAARRGEMGQVAGVGDALKGLFGLGPEADKKAKERSKRAVERLRGKKKFGSSGYDFDAILNQGDNVKGTPLNESTLLTEDTFLMEKKKKLQSPKQFFNPADIKPEYPETPPPAPVLGLHPDLIDGEKASRRYNRLDPISAKSMPLIGDPHIDAKVIAARKKRVKLILRKKNP